MEGFREARNTSSSDNMQVIHYCFATYKKKLKEADFVKKEFLYKKINNKDVYVDCGATECMQLSNMKDLTALN